MTSGEESRVDSSMELDFCKESRCLVTFTSFIHDLNLTIKCNLMFLRITPLLFHGKSDPMREQFHQSTDQIIFFLQPENIKRIFIMDPFDLLVFSSNLSQLKEKLPKKSETIPRPNHIPLSSGMALSVFEAVGCCG